MHQQLRGSQMIWHTDRELDEAVALERRLMKLEDSDRQIKRTTAAHGRRITALEGKQSSPPWTARDWTLTAIGAGILLAAVLEKIGWGPALMAIVKLYGVK